MASNFVGTVHSGQSHFSSRATNLNDEGKFLKIGRIVRVDYETMLIDIVYMDSAGGVPRVTLTCAYGGYRSFLGGMPTTNDWVLLGFTKSGNFFTPYVVQFLHRGYSLGIQNDILQVPKALEDAGIQKPLRFKMQKLYEGEVYGSSMYGSEIHFDKNVTLSNSKLNEIFLRASDQSISLTSVNNYINTSGIRISTGLIHRNELINHPDFQLPDGTSKFPIYYTEDGTPYYTPTYSFPINKENPYGKKTIDDDKQGFIEHRIEVKEMENPVLPVTLANSGVSVDALYRKKPNGQSDKPLIIQVIGTLIGNDPVGEKEKYGVILKPKIFPDKVSTKGKLAEESCFCSDGVDETTTLAAAYTLKLPNCGTAFYINKQGKLFLNASASTSVDSLGSGESAEINLLGHAKVYLGKNESLSRSLSITTDGGVYTNFGSDNVKSRAWDATFRKGVSWNILGKDQDNFAYKFSAEGNVKKNINGSRFTEIIGDDIKIVHGTSEDRVLGKKVDNFVNDKATSYGGNFVETTIGHHSSTHASGRSTKIAAPNILSGDIVADKTEILLGDYSHKMVLGNKNEQIMVGNYGTKMIAGNRSIDIKLGNYSVKLGIGNIDIKTTLGSINVKTTAGNVTIKGTLGVKIESAVKVTLSAPMVKIGSLPQKGVVTELFPCMIVGAPHIGSKSVTCNMI